ncbi:MAG: hypothetical protein KDJ65_08255 [Anaerolineae bacterium]|nr:hypothetical protein [Anaerolineae bacterium]
MNGHGHALWPDHRPVVKAERHTTLELDPAHEMTPGGIGVAQDVGHSLQVQSVFALFHGVIPLPTPYSTPELGQIAPSE